MNNLVSEYNNYSFSCIDLLNKFFNTKVGIVFKDGKDAMPFLEALDVLYPSVHWNSGCKPSYYKPFESHADTIMFGLSLFCSSAHAVSITYGCSEFVHVRDIDIDLFTIAVAYFQTHNTSLVLLK